MQPVIVAADLTWLSSDVSEIGALTEIYFSQNLLPNGVWRHIKHALTVTPNRPPLSPIYHFDYCAFVAQARWKKEKTNNTLVSGLFFINLFWFWPVLIRGSLSCTIMSRASDNRLPRLDTAVWITLMNVAGQKPNYLLITAPYRREVQQRNIVFLATSKKMGTSKEGD